MKMARFMNTASALMLALLLAACGDDGNEPAVTEVPSAFCGSYDDLAERLGCRPLADECEKPPDECDAAAYAWILCLRENLRQCRCEEDDQQLNCEGSFKPSEGPADCIVEYERLDECVYGSGR
jgi:hypothetical protein